MPEETKLKPCHCGQQDYCIGQAALLPGITCKIAAWDTGPKSELERLAREVDECYRLMGKIPADQPNLGVRGLLTLQKALSAQSDHFAEQDKGENRMNGMELVGGSCWCGLPIAHAGECQMQAGRRDPSVSAGASRPVESFECPYDGGCRKEGGCEPTRRLCQLELYGLKKDGSRPVEAQPKKLLEDIANKIQFGDYRPDIIADTLRRIANGQYVVVPAPPADTPKLAREVATKYEGMAAHGKQQTHTVFEVLEACKALATHFAEQDNKGKTE